MEIPVRRLRGEDGNVLITVVLVSMVVGMLASLALTTGTQAQRSSTSDRNYEQALGVAEAGLHQVITRITDQAGDVSPSGFWALAPGTTLPSTCTAGGSCPAARADAAYHGSGPQGDYWYWVTRTTNGFIIDAQSTAGGSSLGRGRHIQVTMMPPSRFPGNRNYALFSYTSINVQNNDQILDGDVFANDTISISQSNHSSANDPTLRGSLTAARGWIHLDSNVYVTGDAWSGGANVTDPNANKHWAIKLGSGAKIAGWAKASNTIPGPCADINYNVELAQNANIAKTLTTLGTLTGTGTVGPPSVVSSNTCSAAAPAQQLPVFTFNPNNYPAATRYAFGSVGAFETWKLSNASNFQGTFFVCTAGITESGDGCVPPTTRSQLPRVDLSGAILTGAVTIVTDAPIYTGTLNDSQNGTGASLVLVSHYQPPDSTACSTEHDNSDCAVHIKNNFSLNADGKCKTATLVYADQGPVAIKNGGSMCGSVISNGILVKNGQTVTYDNRINNVVGFGPATYAITRWQELPAQ